MEGTPMRIFGISLCLLAVVVPTATGGDNRADGRRHAGDKESGCSAANDEQYDHSGC